MLDTQTRRQSDLRVVDWRHIITPFDVMALLFFTFALILGLVTGAPVGPFLYLIAFWGSALALFSAIVIRVLSLDLQFGRKLAGVGLTFVMYTAFGPILDAVTTATIDPALYQLERAMFGTTLVEIVAPVSSVEWTAIFGLIYSVHVPLFFLSASLHWRAGRPDRAEKLLMTLALSMYLGFVGYLVLPAYGPVGWLHTLPPMPTNLATQVVADHGVALGTFPSLHAGISAAVAIDGWRTNRRWGIVFTVIATLVWGSTIYLRYHWVPDLLAGLVLAVFATWLAERIYALWYRGESRAEASAS